MRTYEAEPGESIQKAAENMVAMAKYHGDVVTCTFNDIPLDATAISDPKEIATAYMEEMQRRSDEYHASPEYAEQQRKAKEAQERKEAAQALALAAAPATISLRDPAGWQKAVDVNKADPYSNAVMTFAERWARLMEGKISAGAKLAECADEMCSLADNEGITGFMYGAAVSVLAHTWIHGDELRRWHNRQYMSEEKAAKADETGGVVNPAILIIG